MRLSLFAVLNGISCNAPTLAIVQVPRIVGRGLGRATNRASTSCCVGSAFIFLAISGCAKPQIMKHAIVADSRGYTIDLETKALKPIPGVDYAVVHCFELTLHGGKKRTVVLWTDLNPSDGSGFQDQGTGDPDQYKADVHLLSRADAGTEINCRILFKQKDVGEIVIADQTFDLSMGTVFLIHTKKRKIYTKQLKLDGAGIGLSTDSLRRLVKEEPEIRRFFERGKGDRRL
jgi:hypothetical protein